ncbi:MAG: hypothetical protein ACQES0_11315 [Bacteroidota bacterium]
MKNLMTILFCALFLGFSLTADAQWNKLKNKAKNATEEVKDKKSDSNDSNSDSNSSTVDFSELESQKMEWTSTFERLKKKWDVVSHKEYAQKKADYEEFYKKFSRAYTLRNKKEHSDSYTQELISTVDTYYTPTVSEEDMAALKKKTERCFDKENWSVYPTDRMGDIDDALEEINGLKAYLTAVDPDLNEFEKKLTEQKAEIKAYVDGGGLEERAAEIEKRYIEERRLDEAGMTDASIVNVVKSKIDTDKYGTPSRVVITSDRWLMEYNDYNMPKLKFVKVDIATKKANGKCYYVKGSVARTHEGGGQYGEKYLNIYYTVGEMNCDNVNK